MHPARGCIDADQNIGAPDVRPNRAFDDFEFVDVRDRLRIVGHFDFAQRLHFLGVEKVQDRCADAHHEIRAVKRHAPAFGGELELADLFESVAFVDEPLVRFPSELDEAIAVECQAFAEDVVGQADLLEDFSGRKLDAAKRRFLELAGAFVEAAIVPDQALGEGVCRMRITRNQMPGQDPGGRGRRSDGRLGRAQS